MFEGFPEEALVFYEGLEADNTKAYWTDHKHVYDRAVRAPLDALLADLAPEFCPAQVFRPYRDVRFSKDRTPYKTHAAAVVETDGSLYVQLGAEGLYVGGGYWHTASDQYGGCAPLWTTTCRGGTCSSCWTGWPAGRSSARGEAPAEAVRP